MGKQFWDRLLEEVIEEVEEAERAFLLVAMTHREPVREEVFQSHLGEEGQSLEPLQRLVDRCVLSFDQKNETYRLHGLAKEHLLGTIPKELQVQTHSKAAQYYADLPRIEEPVNYDQVLGEVEASHHHFMAREYEQAAPFRLSQYFLRWGVRELHLEMWQRVEKHLEGRDLALCYNEIGLIYDARGEYDEALEYYRQSEEISKEGGDRAGLAPIYNNIGEIYRARGEYDEALEYYRQSEEIRKEVGDRAGLGTTYNNIGLIYRARGEYDEALEYYRQSEEIKKEVGGPSGPGIDLQQHRGDLPSPRGVRRGAGVLPPK